MDVVRIGRTKEVVIQTYDDLRLTKAVERTNPTAEGFLQAITPVIFTLFAVGDPPHILKALLQLLPQRLYRRRYTRLSENSDSCRTCLRDAPHLVCKILPRRFLAISQYDFGPVGIVKTQDGSLFEDAARAQAHRVLWVALYLRRPPLMAANENRTQRAAEGHRRGVAQWQPRYDFFRLTRVW